MTGLTPQLQTGLDWVVGVLLVAEVGDARGSNADRQDAGPADVGDRIGKLAGAGGRTGGEAGAGHAGERGGEQDGSDAKEAATGIHGDTANSSIRNRSPSCDTRAGTWVMPKRRVEQSLLVVVDREVPGLHQVQVGAADQDRLHPALVEGDQLPGAADLTRVTGIEEQQVPGQRHHLQRVLARAGGKQQFSLGAEDVAIQREARVEVEGPHRFGRTQAGDRRRILHGRDAPFPDLCFEAPEFAAAFLRAQALLDHLEQMGFADLVGRPDDAQVHGPCASRAQHQT